MMKARPRRFCAQRANPIPSSLEGSLARSEIRPGKQIMALTQLPDHVSKNSPGWRGPFGYSPARHQFISPYHKCDTSLPGTKVGARLEYSASVQLSVSLPSAKHWRFRARDSGKGAVGAPTATSHSGYLPSNSPSARGGLKRTYVDYVDFD